MLKSLNAEESVREYLDSVAPDSGFVTGLILGQQCQQRAYVVHMPPTPNFESKDEDDEPSTQTLQTLADLNAYSLQSHAKNVSGLLSGGLHIIGIYSVCKDNSTGLLDTKEPKKLQTLVGKLNSPLPEQIVLHYNVATKKALCRFMDSKMHLTNIDLKFQANPVPWEEVETQFVFDFKSPLPTSANVSNTKSNLKDLLDRQEKLLANALCLIEGSAQDGNATLDTVGEEDHESRLVAQFFIQTTPEAEASVSKNKCAGLMVVNGHVNSRIFVHPKTTVSETVAFLKEDIIRSLRTRVELHTDALIDEDEGSPEEKVVQHDLPRRVLFQLPCTTVKISNYLFPGESPSDSQDSLELLLGCQFDGEAEELEEELSCPELLLPSSEESRELTPTGMLPSTKPNSLALYASLAGLILVVAICFGILINK